MKLLKLTCGEYPVKGKHRIDFVRADQYKRAYEPRNGDVGSVVVLLGEREDEGKHYMETPEQIAAMLDLPEGMTDEPTHEGVYWCEVMHSIGSAPWRGLLEWRGGEWWEILQDGRRGMLSSTARVSCQRLFTETYTPTGKTNE